MSGWNHDLVVLVADACMEAALRGILGRHRSLPIRPVRVDYHTHVERDPGCLLRGHDFLRPLASQYAHGLVVFDREGCGEEASSRVALLEVWVWSDSPHVEDVLGWHDRTDSLREWLTSQGLLHQGHPKPERPKEAVERTLRLVRKPPSSQIYSQLATHVSLDRCTDPAFLKLRRLLTTWFPSSSPV